MLTDLLAAHPAMTLERGPLLGCIELGSAGGTAAFHGCRSEARLDRAPADAWSSPATRVSGSLTRSDRLDAGATLS
jgi:hypothetical protein